MRKHSFSFLVIMLATGVFASTAPAQGIFSGIVLDHENNEFEGATIIMESTSSARSSSGARHEVTSDAGGRFVMIGLASGQWTITIEAEGFQPQSSTTTIRQGPNSPMNIYLERILHPLEIALGDALGDVDPAALTDELFAADAAYNSQQWDQALTAYRSILEQLPSMTQVNMQIGAILRELEQYEEAIAAFEQAAAANPELEAEVGVEIARIKMTLGDFEAAGDALAASVAAGDGAAREDLYNLGELEFAKGNIDAAAGFYEKASAADPDWALPLFKLALVALNKGDMDTAKQFFSQVVEKDPDSEEGAQARATLDALP